MTGSDDFEGNARPMKISMLLVLSLSAYPDTMTGRDVGEAIRHGNLCLLKPLVADDSVPAGVLEESGLNPLETAVYFQQYEIFNELLSSHEFFCQGDLNKALVVACTTNMLSMIAIELVLNSGTSVKVLVQDKNYRHSAVVAVDHRSYGYLPSPGADPEGEVITDPGLGFSEQATTDPLVRMGLQGYQMMGKVQPGAGR